MLFVPPSVNFNVALDVSKISRSISDSFAFKANEQDGKKGIAPQV